MTTKKKMRKVLRPKYLVPGMSKAIRAAVKHVLALEALEVRKASIARDVFVGRNLTGTLKAAKSARSVRGMPCSTSKVASRKKALERVEAPMRRLPKAPKKVASAKRNSPIRPNAT